MGDAHVTRLADGRDLGWTEYGDAGGWPVLGFHGTPGSRLQVAVHEAPVLAAGVRLVAPDRPGYGFSTFQPGRRLVDWPRDVEQLADHLGIDRFSVMGISGGGPHAAACAALLPGRVAAAAIVSGAGPLADPRAAEDMMRSNQVIASLARKRSPVLRVLADLQVALARRFPRQAIELMVKQLPPADAAVLRREDVNALFHHEVAAASRTTGRAVAQDFELFAADWGFALESIRVPVFLWQGDADRNVPPQHATLMHDLIPGSTLHTFEGEGHFLVIERLEAILQELVPR